MLPYLAYNRDQMLILNALSDRKLLQAKRVLVANIGYSSLMTHCRLSLQKHLNGWAVYKHQTHGWSDWIAARPSTGKMSPVIEWIEILISQRSNGFWVAYKQYMHMHMSMRIHYHLPKWIQLRTCFKVWILVIYLHCTKTRVYLTKSEFLWFRFTLLWLYSLWNSSVSLCVLNHRTLYFRQPTHVLFNVGTVDVNVCISDQNVML